jgi:hypothetical protein
VRGIPSLLSSSSTVTVANSDEDEDDAIAVANYLEDIGITDPNLLHNLCSSNALSCRLPMVWDRPLADGSGSVTHQWIGIGLLPMVQDWLPADGLGSAAC